MLDSIQSTVGPYAQSIVDLIEAWSGVRTTPTIVYAVVTTVLCYPIIRLILKGDRRRNALHVAKRKQLVKASHLDAYDTDKPSVAGYKDILSLTATELVKAIREKRYSAEDVMKVYVWSAVKADRTLNCVTESRFEEAIAEARRADAMLASGKSLGPLHGLPFSVKDSLDLEGLDSTLGVAKRCFKPAKDDFLLGKMLVNAGAIPYVKTNIPQTLLSFESDNPIWGKACNPHSKGRSPGGSSGGEGALIAAKGSPIGIGTDIGGSVRIPAAYCGIYGIKPTQARCSRIGAQSSVPGQAGVPGVIGPLGQCTEDLAMVFRAWLQEEMWKTDLIAPMPFNEADYSSQKKLVIGYYDDDGFLAAAPSYKRAVAIAVEALKKKGHTLVPYQPPDMLNTMKLYYSLLSADGAKTILAELDGEVVIPAVKKLLSVIQLPGAVRRLLAFVTGSVLGWKRMNAIVTSLWEVDVSNYWKLLAQRDQYRRTFLAGWNDQGLDAIIAPGHGLLAVPHGASKDLTPTCSYTMLYNLMDLPAGSVPVTRATEGDMKELEKVAAGAREKLEKDACKAGKDSVGLPVAVQVAAFPYKEEVCLRVMKDIESSVNYV